MATDIKCPSCGELFALGEAEAEEYKKELQQKMTAYVKQKEDEFRRKTEDLERQRSAMEAAALKKASEELAAQLKAMEDESRLKSLQLQEMQKKELEFLREKNELEQRSRNLDIEIEKRLLEDRKKIEQETMLRESQLFDMRMKEKELQLESMKRTIEELKRKSEQGLTQAQGEAQELMLEKLLGEHFPFDSIEEVGKGIEGADCIHVVRNISGKECGKIIYESKRTKGWSSAWVEKLKNDMRSTQADLAILVTQTFPKGMDCFGEKEGVWVCSFKEVIGLSTALRHAIIRIAETKRSEENKGEKMQMLYNYLTGIEFRQHVEAILESFLSMKQSITRERVQMEKIWKEREKQLDKVLLNTSGLFGSIKGIAGASVEDIPLLETAQDEDAA
ncbi:MAG TPA: DUF2130 domain-containing protein [Chitinophagaceae bacterium]|nr:DUF2130 domain-containing protein [Chitinophagaceae bacterium]